LQLDKPLQRERADDKALFQTYGPMVRRIALKTIRSLPRTITLDDIISAGWVGMSEALGRRPVDMPQEQFEAYSSYRIRGAILDYLRHLDPLSRRLRGIARALTRATNQLTQELGYLPDQEQIAERM
jgi:RNA polymerase sigma factor for flagellar operon FliA